MIQRIAIVGCGLVGSSWASFFASKGLRARMYDLDPAACQFGAKRAEQNLRNLVRLKYLPPDALDACLANIQPVESAAAVVEDCDYVQESVSEDYETKSCVYRLLEQNLSPQAIIASSSSGLLISTLQQSLEYPERSLIAHPFNPPHLIPLVELVPGEQTRPATVTDVKEFFQDLGKCPVVLNKERPGHIANRLAAAVWREALALLDDDVASLEDIDTALCAGPGLRWALMGQHLTYELGGGEKGYQGFIDSIGRSFSAYWEDMQTWTEIPDTAKAKAISGTQQLLQQRTRDEWIQWRDEKLVRLLQLLDD